MMMDRGCPGQDRSNWTPDDIFEVACTNCGATIEFFKDDAKRYCKACGTCNANPKHGHRLRRLVRGRRQVLDGAAVARGRLAGRHAGLRRPGDLTAT